MKNVTQTAAKSNAVFQNTRRSQITRSTFTLLHDLGRVMTSLEAIVTSRHGASVGLTRYAVSWLTFSTVVAVKFMGKHKHWYI